MYGFIAQEFYLLVKKKDAETTVNDISRVNQASQK